MRGAPDWVVKVLSPASAAHGQMTKRGIIYERHGVKEYWLIHSTDRVLTVYPLLGTAYGKPDRRSWARGCCPVSSFSGLRSPAGYADETPSTRLHTTAPPSLGAGSTA